MTPWILKAMVQGAISPLPGREHLNYVLQKHMTGSVVLTEARFERKVAECRRHLQSYRETHGDEKVPSSVLELGTGWYPTVPVGLALAGVPRVTTIDVRPLLKLPGAHAVIELYSSQLQSGRLQAVLPEISAARANAVIAASHDSTVRHAGKLLQQLGVRMLVGDVRASGLPEGSVELFVSNNTLEHIAPSLLSEILGELRRLAAPGAVMDHFVDMSDHYAHFDPAITEFNFLQYADRAWRVFNNRLQYQNRLRISDYRHMIKGAGFEMVAEETERGAPEELDRVKLAPRFGRYTPEDLLALRSYMTAIARPSRAMR